MWQEVPSLSLLKASNKAEVAPSDFGLFSYTKNARVWDEGLTCPPWPKRDEEAA